MLPRLRGNEDPQSPVDFAEAPRTWLRPLQGARSERNERRAGPPATGGAGSNPLSHPTCPQSVGSRRMVLLPDPGDLPQRLLGPDDVSAPESVPPGEIHCPGNPAPLPGRQSQGIQPLDGLRGAVPDHPAPGRSGPWRACLSLLLRHGDIVVAWSDTWFEVEPTWLPSCTLSQARYRHSQAPGRSGSLGIRQPDPRSTSSGSIGRDEAVGHP